MSEQKTVSKRKTEGATKSSDCGPKSVSVTVKGSWQENKFVASDSAADQAKFAAERRCKGACNPQAQTCKYVEEKSTIGAQEERQDPNNPTVAQFRFECTSEGRCQCE